MYTFFINLPRYTINPWKMSSRNANSCCSAIVLPYKLASIESLRLQWSNLCARHRSNLSIETIRSFTEFLGLQSSPANRIQFSPTAFTMTPITSGGDQNVIYEKIRNRIEQNCTYYLSNYALIATMTALVILLLHPNVIFTFAMLSALWWFHGYLIRHKVVLGSVRVHEVFPVQHRFYILFLQSCFMILVTCVIPTVLFLLISSFIILCHAMFRDTSHLQTEG
jgi:PRA1 family protein